MKFPICHDVVEENGKLYEFISSIGKYAEVKLPKILQYVKQGDEVHMKTNKTPYPLNVVGK